jgi:iron(II)-dependent oxidoreductase
MKRPFPLILRSGKTFESIDELIEFALKNPNLIKGECFAISKWIDAYPIANLQFALFLEESGFMKLNQSEMERYKQIISHGKGKGADYPIHNISWYEAKAYCEWANKTLPTEARWEKAARGGEDNRIFPWGNEVNSDIMNTIEKSHPFPDGVKVQENKKNISPYGCIQMVGNIYEWCLDWFDKTFHSRDITENPYCSEPTPQKVKVLRGGSTGKPIPYARCLCRDFAPPEIKADFTGFRAVWVSKI